MKEKMNPYFAVFNAHDPDLRKAREAFNKHFGKGVYQKRISPFMRKGIMTIFHKPPNNWTRWYVNRLTEFVNARLEKEGYFND